MSNFDKFHEMSEKLRAKIQAFPNKPIENPPPVAIQKKRGALLQGMALMTKKECKQMVHELEQRGEKELAGYAQQFIKDNFE